MSHLSADLRLRAEDLIALYPEPRSALIPLCHLAQEQDGWLRPEAMEEIASLVGVTAAEVRGTATFYDMLHTEPVGTHVVAICTNIACLLQGAPELVAHAESSLGIRVGGTTSDGTVTLEEAECLAGCDGAPCVQVNYRYVDATTPERFDELVAGLRSGAFSEDIPAHGTLVRVRRSVSLAADPAGIIAERAAMAREQDARAAATANAEGAGGAAAGDAAAGGAAAGGAAAGGAS